MLELTKEKKLIILLIAIGHFQTIPTSKKSPDCGWRLMDIGKDTSSSWVVTLGNVKFISFPTNGILPKDGYPANPFGGSPTRPPTTVCYARKGRSRAL